MSKPIINIADVEFQPGSAAFTATGAAAERFEARTQAIGARIGAQHLGYNITEVPPGKRAFPIHNHRVNEEMFFILEGRGEVRVGEQTYAIRAGDIIACPPGGRDTAHQIVNSGTVPLRYLAVSTKLRPDIVEYPDSDKFAVLGQPPDADGQPQDFVFIGRAGNSIGYWDGE
ncbi:cupin domain-containing protein [Pseudoduganella sp. UC29_106]|uniref:cupin domain-containing protein n=1 Tax=Pseudoduganella sp. UC29_106 TaxID=3374553 RepID=UPI0037577AC0